MKKNILKTLILLTMLAGVFFTACEDEFTEKDVLNAQQTLGVSIYVYDPATDSSLVDATVTLVNGGIEVVAETTELGIAYFSNVKIGDNVIIRVEKAGYIKRITDVDITTDNYRQSQYSANISLYSLTQNTATIKGRIKIETDLTNEDTEFAPEGTEVYAFLSLGGTPIKFTATVDANGEYEFTVPADRYGVYYTLGYETLELSQTIAKNRNVGDPDFPETVPSIVSINTVFNSSGSALSVPYVQPVYGLIDGTAPHTGTAVIYNVDVDGNGQINGIDIYPYGSGYTDLTVDITIVSLFGGSGADYTVNVSGGSLYDWNINEINAGSGYPIFSNANRTGSELASFSSSVSNVKTGDIIIVNGDYGTGNYRETEIE